MRIVLSGFGNNIKLHCLLEENGIQIDNIVDNNTSYLVLPDSLDYSDNKSAKIKHAMTYNTKIMNIEDFMRLYKITPWSIYSFWI